MKEQYAGDINDYRKFAILRRLRDDGRTRIGVCWMLTPPDGRNDGARTQFLQQPNVWRRYDPELHDKLNALATTGSTEPNFWRKAAYSAEPNSSLNLCRQAPTSGRRTCAKRLRDCVAASSFSLILTMDFT